MSAPLSRLFGQDPALVCFQILAMSKRPSWENLYLAIRQQASLTCRHQCLVQHISLLHHYRRSFLLELMIPSTQTILLPRKSKESSHSRSSPNQRNLFITGGVCTAALNKQGAKKTEESRIKRSKAKGYPLERKSKAQAMAIVREQIAAAARVVLEVVERTES